MRAARQRARWFYLPRQVFSDRSRQAPCWPAGHIPSDAPTAANEIHEALTDISRRPTADVTGAIQHAMAALECVAREVDGSSDTLGRIIGRLTLPAPLDGALHKLWGFASEQGRHIQEGREPRFEEAELVVTVASAVSVYLLRHHARAPLSQSG